MTPISAEALQLLREAGLSPKPSLWPPNSRVLLKRAFRKLALSVHPDHGGDSTRFIRLKTAYDLLSRFGGEQQAPKSNFFERYKELTRQYNQAVSDYFERRKMLILDPSDPDYVRLKEQLVFFRSSYVDLLQEDPRNVFAGDIRDKLRSITNWLGTK